MNGIIWYENKLNGENQLKNIINNYKKLNILPVVNNIHSNGRTIIFNNGDTWGCYPAKECMRGRKTNISYIEKTIEKDVVNTIIEPMTTAYPYSGINFY